MRLLELQDDDKEAKKLKSEELPKSCKDINKVLHYQSFLNIPKVICLELINRHHDNLFVGHFGIEKIWNLIAKKYYWPILQRDVEAYIKGCDVCFALKIVCHKPYNNFQSLSVRTH